ncbi:GNAT family acetyltransferase [Pseudomonas viridiflava]|uniref:GNAT family acetyltransferase n=1 Tax=Pseudomonas viridiflava TaxID=33069 RepID=UPI0015E49493|nr:GNAT family acetyltransferase [Pseudomonas viridiflava]MBA1228312.1 GNAT family acetyltransferase [Pseudomonas viridiflava]
MHRVFNYADSHHRLAVIELWQAVFDDDAPHNRPDLSIDMKLEVGDELFFVAVLEDRITGTLMAGYDGHRGWLYSVAVDPQHRGQGVGTLLVRHAEQALIKLGCIKINLQVRTRNEGVKAFYETLGYVQEPIISLGKRILSGLDKKL